MQKPLPEDITAENQRLGGRGMKNQRFGERGGDWGRGEESEEGGGE